MPIDYSKWDKIELSDDSDIEVHPNVDKKSFIRWKQQDIHQKRDQRNQDIKTIETQNGMYAELNKRVDQILVKLSEAELADYEYIKTYLASNFDPNSKPQYVEEDAPTHNEMIEDLFTQLKSDLEKAGQNPSDGSKIKELIVSHRKKIDEVQEKNNVRLQELYKERELHISSEDMHTGWDHSFMNKSNSSNASKETSKTTSAAPVSTSTSSYTKPDTTNAASIPTTSSSQPAAQIPSESTPSTSTTLTQTSSQVEEQSGDAEVELDDLDPDTLAYSKIPIDKIDEIKKFLKTHTHIINPNQKDSLLMKAFDAQFAHDNKKTYQIIFLSTILQYIYDIIEYKRTKHPQEIAIVVEQLLSKMFINTTNQAYDAFKGEVERTFTHIKTRCEILTQEQLKEVDEADQEIQLKSLDENTELVVNLPDSQSEDPSEIKKYKAFQRLPKPMQDALHTGSLDAVNDVFHGMPIPEAEAILEIFEESEIIGVQAIIDNEQDWRHIKDEYEKSQEGAGDVKFEEEVVQTAKIEELEIQDDQVQNTADIVD